MNDATKGDGKHGVASAAATTPFANSSGDTLARTIVPGTVGPYRILRRLGNGTFGPICLANDPAHEREIAVRIFDPTSLPWLTAAKANIAFLDAARPCAVAHDLRGAQPI